MQLSKNISFLLLLMCAALCMFFVSFAPKDQRPMTKLDTLKRFNIKDQTVQENGIQLSFDTFEMTEIGSIQLLLSGTYGTTRVIPRYNSEKSIIEIPAVLSKHAGIVSYIFLQNGKSIQEGSFQLLPDTTKLGVLENYLGPRSIMANERDYTMLVSIPTDSLDNLLPDNTELQLKTQFKGTIVETPKQLVSGFTWQRIQAPLQKGRLSTGSTLGNISSKELVVDIFPDIPEDFGITTDTHHTFADGNEVITFKTSQIKDSQNNIMTDGTLVTFYIENEQGEYWNTNASTVNGFAFAKALHPQQPGSWKIKGVIKGMAESPEITQSFDPFLTNIPLIAENRTITIGPLTSYLGQIIQEGITITVTIDGKTTTLLTKNGKAYFLMDEAQYPTGNYEIIIKTLGLEVTKTISLL